MYIIYLLIYLLILLATQGVSWVWLTYYKQCAQYASKVINRYGVIKSHIVQSSNTYAAQIYLHIHLMVPRIRAKPQFGPRINL